MSTVNSLRNPDNVSLLNNKFEKSTTMDKPKYERVFNISELNQLNTVIEAESEIIKMVEEVVLPAPVRCTIKPFSAST